MHSPLRSAPRDHSRDSDLAQRVASGDRDSQHELFRQLRSSVHATLYRVLGSNEHMEDLLQDAFVEIFRAIPHYRGEAQLTTWADRIVARVAFHYLKRKRRRREREAVSVQLHVVGSPEEHAQHRESLERLYALLRRMKPEQHISLALFLVDGRSLEEVAAMTGVSVVAAKNRISRARRKLWEAAGRDPTLMGYLIEQGAVE
jgi:RNA polymerase sigma-70 factor, ECF subfamily